MISTDVSSATLELLAPFFDKQSSLSDHYTPKSPGGKFQWEKSDSTVRTMGTEFLRKEISNFVAIANHRIT
jgi:hypothetical protein